MPENPNAQIPATENQIEMERPRVGRSFNLLVGNIQGSMNAGHERLVGFQEVMAGQRIAVTGGRLLIQMLTPLTPAFQKLKACLKVIKVPFQRVWKNYQNFAAQKGGSTEEKPQMLPNLAGKKFPYVTIGLGQEIVSIQETTAWRDHFASCIIPRVGAGAIGRIDDIGSDDEIYRKAPEMTALYLRAHVAAWNDELRNKEYDPEAQEYTEFDEVSQLEWLSYMPDYESDLDYQAVRCKKDNSYYSNYRAELQGFESGIPGIDEETTEDQSLVTFAEWQHQTAEAVAQAANAQKNAWDVMQELRGARKLTQGRVELLARKTFNINYSAVTQNAYNNNPEINENFRVLGKQGAYSFTDIDLTFLNGQEIEEDGVLLFYLSVTADTVYESAVDRTLLNIGWKDRYRPDLSKEKNDILMKIETGTPYAYEGQATDEYEPLGFKQKFTEYFKLPNCINGDMMNRGYYQSNAGDNNDVPGTLIETNGTYQFNEFSAEKAQKGVNGVQNKKHWKDYSDFMVNKNLAIPQETYGNDEGQTAIYGQHQIFYVGKIYSITDMPIEESIKTGFTKWGEF